SKGLQLWDVEGKALGPPQDHQYTLGKLMFSPDGKKLLTYCGEHVARLWNIQDPEAPQLIGVIIKNPDQGGDRQILGMAFSPEKKNTKWVATVGREGYAQLWEASTAKPGPPLQTKLPTKLPTKQKDKAVYAVQFKGKAQVVTGGNGELRFHVLGKDTVPQ